MKRSKFVFKKIISASLALIIASTCALFVSCDNEKTPADVPTEAPTEAPEENWDDVAKVIILAGQSNMAGATSIISVNEEMCPNYRKGFSDIQILFTSGSRGDTANKWNTSNGKFTKVRLGQGASKALFGPEFGLAQYLTEAYPDEEIYLVKHAIGGALIDDYLNDESELYLNAFAQTRVNFDAAIAEIKTRTDKKIKVVAICWMQGESEGILESTADTYEEKLSQLANRFREEYKDYAPDGGIPFIDGGISDSTNWPFHEKINLAKQSFASKSPDINYYIDTIGAGLTLGPDNAHYDAASEIKLGQLFGECIVKWME